MPGTKRHTIAASKVAAFDMTQPTDITCSFGMPNHANPVDEPGVNTVKCPRHNHWLYRRQKIDADPGVDWCCGVEGCDYGYHVDTKGDPVRA